MNSPASQPHPQEKAFFLRALELESAEEQRRFLDTECHEDTALHARLAHLLDLSAATDDLLIEPADLNDLEIEREAIAEDLAKEERVRQQISDRLDTLGDYSLIEEIGRGAMGVVFRAKQESLNREVAVKVLLSAALASPAERKRFQVEAEASASLEHAHIVPVYEIGHEEDYDYYSMALIRGGTLGDSLVRKDLDRRQGVALIAKVASAIQCAHEQGIIHRDLKPDNILLDDSGEPHVSDFGLSFQLDRESHLTLSGQIMGTPQYMAPEQADTASAPITTAVDQFALGTILYELLAGEPAFRGESVLETLRLVRVSEPTPLRQLDPSIDRDLATIVSKSLEKAPAHRYKSMQAFADDLDAWLHHRPIAARPATPRERLLKWTRRNPAYAGLLGTSALFLLTLGIGGPIMALRQAELGAQAQAASTQAWQQATENRRLAYAASMRLAGVATTDHTLVSTIQSQLDIWKPDQGEAESDMRGWEWYFLASFADQSTLSIPFQGRGVRQLELSPSGEHLACLLEEAGSFQIWETASTRHVKSIESAHKTLVTIAWSPDGHYLVSASEAGMIDVWEPESGDLLRQADLGLKLNGASWSADGGEIIACAVNGPLLRLEAYSLESMGVLDTALSNPFFRDGPERLAWSPDSRFIAVSGVLHDFNAHFKVYTVDDLSAPAKVTNDYHMGSVRDLQWSGDGELLAAAGWKGVIKIQTAAGDPVIEWRNHTGKLEAIAWRPDGAALASASRNGELFISDVETGEIIRKFPGHTHPISELEWTPDGRTLVSGDESGVVRYWDTGENPVSRILLQTEYPARRLQPNPDGKTLLVGVRPKKMLLVDVASGASQLLDGRWSGTPSLIWSADGRYVMSGSSTLLRVKGISRVTEEPPIPLGARGFGKAWEPGGRKLATNTYNGRFGIWDIDTHSMTHTFTEESQPPLWAVAWSPDAKFAVAIGDQHRRVLGRADGQLVYDASAPPDEKSGRHTSHSWSPDSRHFAAASTTRKVLIYSVDDPEPVASLVGHSSQVHAVAWHPKGTRLASGGDDRTVRIWNPQTQQLLLTLTGHTDSVQSLAWIHDGRALVSAGLDGTIRIWDASRAYEAEANE